MTSVVALIADWIDSRHQIHPIRVAIDGADASGKTTLANALADELGRRDRRSSGPPLTDSICLASDAIEEERTRPRVTTSTLLIITRFAKSYCCLLVRTEIADVGSRFSTSART
jgi:hypothetical protein